MSLSSLPRQLILRGLPGLWMAALAGLPLACAKQEVPADCLVIPEASQVEMVKVALRNADGTTKSDYQIDTRPRIEELIAALKGHRGEACRTVVKSRPQEMSVSFQGYDSVPLILWIGPDWIGGVDTKKGPDGWLIGRWRPLGAAERASLLSLLRKEG
jgi:hypothetical protein